LADIRVLDVWGLGSLEVGRAMLRGGYDREHVYELAKANDIRIGILNGASGLIPPQWIKVGQWQIGDNVALASDTVWFYAVNPAEVETLTENLRQFASRLPTSVKQTGEYAE
jgi:hypothetical protein